ANSMTTMPAVGLALENIPAGSFGRLVGVGRLNNANTSAFAQGDLLYVSPTVAGGITNVRPALPSLVQSIGVVETSDAASGTIQVITRPPSGTETGTISSSWRIGSGTPGVKTLGFFGSGT